MTNKEKKMVAELVAQNAALVAQLEKLTATKSAPRATAKKSGKKAATTKKATPAPKKLTRAEAKAQWVEEQGFTEADKKRYAKVCKELKVALGEWIAENVDGGHIDKKTYGKLFRLVRDFKLDNPKVSYDTAIEACIA